MNKKFYREFMKSVYSRAEDFPDKAKNIHDPYALAHQIGFFLYELYTTEKSHWNKLLKGSEKEKGPEQVAFFTGQRTSSSIIRPGEVEKERLERGTIAVMLRNKLQSKLAGFRLDPFLEEPVLHPPEETAPHSPKEAAPHFPEEVAPRSLGTAAPHSPEEAVPRSVGRAIPYSPVGKGASAEPVSLRKAVWPAVYTPDVPRDEIPFHKVMAPLLSSHESMVDALARQISATQKAHALDVESRLLRGVRYLMEDFLSKQAQASSPWGGNSPWSSPDTRWINTSNCIR